MRKSIPEVRQMWLAILEDKRLEEIAMKELIERIKVKQGPEAVLISGLNRTHEDKKKKASKEKCRKDKIDENNA